MNLRFDATIRRPSGEVEEIILVAGSIECALALAHMHNLEVLEGPTPMARGRRIEIDFAAVSDAAELFGLRRPVRVRTNGRQGPTNGNYRFSADPVIGTFHNIMVKSYLDAGAASRALWHELTHAWQAEREIQAAGQSLDEWRPALVAWRACTARGRGTAYRSRPIEVEAREYEEFAADLPLTKELSR